MQVELEQEALVELKGTRELLHQVPHALQELVDHRRHLLGVTLQVSVPGNNGIMIVFILVLTLLKHIFTFSQLYVFQILYIHGMFDLVKNFNEDKDLFSNSVPVRELMSK